MRRECVSSYAFALPLKKSKLLAVLTITILICSCLPAFFASESVQASSLTLVTSKDTYISGYPSESTNHGTTSDLLVGTWTYGIYQERERALLEFPKPWGGSIPAGSTITFAYLQLYYYSFDKASALSPDPAGSQVFAQRLLRVGLDFWLESQANWNRYVLGSNWNTAGAAGVGTDYTTTNQASTIVPASYGQMNWNVLGQVQWAQTNDEDIAFRVVAPTLETAGTVLQFYSGQYANSNYWPKLIISYVPPQAPTVGTIGADNVTYNSATCYGKIISVGSTSATRRGIKYGLTQTDTWDIGENGSFGAEEYSFNLTSLLPDTTYYYRAYATNTYGTGYGSWESFVTVTGVPIVTTDSVYTYSFCTGITAVMSGTITNIGNSTVTTRGFQYGLSPYSATGDTHENGIWHVGSYSLTEFIASNASYWFRAYAVNTEGTGYGIWKPFYPLEGPTSDCSGGGGANVTGSGTAGDPYVIWTDYGLQEMQNHLSSYWELGCNINATGTSSWNAGAGFNPVGISYSKFTGQLDGQNYTITGLYINRPSKDGVGMFGYALPSGSLHIKNFVLANCEVHGRQTTGILAGSAGAVQYVHVINSKVSGNSLVGGLLGSGRGEIYRCSAQNVTVYATPYIAGALIGIIAGGTTLHECFSTGSVTTITRGVAGGLLSGQSTASAANVHDCYSRASVSIPVAPLSGSAGGGAGMLTGPTSCTRIYSTGSVTGGDPAHPEHQGGLVGYIISGTVTNSFWDMQTSGKTTSDGGTGKTTAEMTTNSTFIDAGWDFDTIWGMDPLINDGYPYLRWALTIPPEEATTYTLSLSHLGSGAVTVPGEGSFEYAYNQVVSIVATPSVGYRFAMWVGDISEVGDAHSFSTTVTMTGNFNIIALFVSEGKLALYITSSSGGNVTDPGEGLFAYDLGDLVDLEATADGSYAFTLWTGDVDEVDNVADSITFIQMLDDYAIRANFATAGTCVLVVSSTSGGTVLEPGEGTFEYAPATVVDLAAWPNPGCWFVNWTGDVGTIDDVNNATTNITMSGNYSITAVFGSGDTFDLTLSSSDGGSVTSPGEGTFTFSAGTTVNIEAEADSGYEFFAWTGDVSTVADVADTSTTIVMTGDCVVMANFEAAEECSLLLTISAAEGGYVSEPGEGVFTFPCGTQVVITALSYEGYWFKGWTGDTGSVANPLSFNTTIVMSGDFFIEATFEKEEAPLPGAPTVVTGNATSVTWSSATLHGELTSLGNYTQAYVFLQYGLNTSYGVNTPWQLRTSTGNFSRAISNLSTNTTYHYRAVAQYDSYVYGLDGNFTTSEGESEEPPGQEYNKCGDTYEYASYTAGDNETATVYGANWFAQTFNVTEAFKISSVRLKLAATGSSGALTVSIRNIDINGKPTGVDLTSASYEGTGPSTGWYEVTMPVYRLETKEYAIVVRAVAGDAANYIGWCYDPDGAYAGGTYVSSSTSGVSWAVDGDKDLMFQIFGSSVLCLLDAKVFSSYMYDNDWLICVHYLNEYPPYYGVATPSDYFDLQLVANGNVVASVGVPLWGDMPGSIYLSNVTASSLEWGSTYTVRMRGSFDPHPTAVYTLTPEDWRGEDLNLLDAWVFEVANEMSTYYEQSLTLYVERRQVLNDAGSALFATGIPMLAAVRPTIFLDPQLYTPESAADWQHTYENAQHWQEVLGNKIATDATKAGTALGIPGQQFAQVAFFGTWFVAAIASAASLGVAPLIVSLPFLAGGWYAGLISTTIFAVVGSIFILVLVWYFWIRGGG